MQKAIDDKIRHFFSDYPTRRYNQRHLLIYTDDPVTHVFYLLKGTVKQYAISYSGDEIILNMFKAGSFFPMDHAVNRTKARYLFEAEEDIEVQQVPVDDVVEFVRTNPDVLYDLLRRVYTGTEGILGRMEQLMSGSAKARLTYELILESRRLGEKKTGGGYTIPISEKVLGSLSGLTRETVNREIHKLKEKGLIVIQNNSIFIPDISALERSIS